MNGSKAHFFCLHDLSFRINKKIFSALFATATHTGTSTTAVGP
jgi:hypothetical protein